MLPSLACYQGALLAKTFSVINEIELLVWGR